jgi:hypothetical protein
MIVEYKGKSYRVTDDSIEVYIPAGPPRVMQLTQRSSYWRTLKPNSLIGLRVRIEADNIKRKEQRNVIPAPD